MQLKHYHQKYQNSFLLLTSILVLIIFINSPLFATFSHIVANYPLISALISGVLFASTFTAIVGGIVIVQLGTSINPILLILLACIGAVIFDSIVFFLFKEHATREANLIYKQLNHYGHLKKITHTKYFAWTLAVIGTLIIASPLPDELGISLLGLSKTKFINFIYISAISHLFGIGSVLVISLNVNV